MDTSVQADSILLHHDLLLDQRVDLLLQEVALVHIVLLQLLEVFLKVGDVFDDLLEDVIGRLCGVMLESGAFTPQELHFLLVVIQKFHSLLCVPLSSYKARVSISL